jgi:hypothetical protein
MFIAQWSFKFGSQFILVFCGGHELIVFELKSSLFMWVGGVGRGRRS